MTHYVYEEHDSSRLKVFRSRILVWLYRMWLGLSRWPPDRVIVFSIPDGFTVRLPVFCDSQPGDIVLDGHGVPRVLYDWVCCCGKPFKDHIYDPNLCGPPEPVFC